MKTLFAILFFFLLFTQSKAIETTKISLQLHWKYQYEFSGFIVAKEKGYYKDVGLDVELKEISFGDNRYEMLRNQTSEFFIFSSDIIGEQIKGLPATLVSSYFQRVPLAFATKPNIYFPIDLKNKKVMGTTNYKGNIIFENLFYSANMKLNDIKFIPHSFDIEDFISGKVDAIQIYIINEPYELDKRKVPYNIIDVNNYGIEFNGIIVATHKDYAKQNPELVKKFHEATQKGWQYAIDNKEEAVDIILEKYNTQNKSKEALMFEAKRSENVILPNVYPLGSLSENKIQQVIDMYEKLNILKDVNIKAKDLIFNHNKINKIELTPKEKAFLIKKTALNLCAAPTWMPYDAVNKDNKHIGLAGDLYTQFTKNLDIKFNLIKTNSWNQSLEFMKEKKCDVLSLAHENKTRKEYMNFTSSIMELNYVIATKSSELFIDKFETVLDKKFVSVKGDSVTHYLKETYPNLKLIEVDNTYDALKMVSNNEAFGFIDTTLSIGHAITKYGLHDLKITGDINWISKLSVATSISNPIFHSIMQKAVDSISVSQKSQLMNKLVNVKYEKGIDYSLVWTILLVSTLLILLFIYWNRKISISNKLLQEANRTIDIKNKELELLATTDKLTGIYNRNKLDEILIDESNRTNRSHFTFGIIILDIDYFKSVNDIYGHQIGDKVLKEFATILKSNIRETDTVGRWGGEEFMIICVETNSKGIKALAEVLKEKISSYNFSIEEQKTASLGVTIYKSNEDIDTLIKRADDALYKAKEKGRNIVEFL